MIRNLTNRKPYDRKAVIAADGLEIHVGDELHSKWGFNVEVYEDDGKMVGRLLMSTWSDIPSVNGIPYDIENCPEDYTHIPF